MIRTFIAGAALLCSLAAHAELKVFACEPEWQSLAEALGGDLVQAQSATTALQDPHYIQARPSLISKLRQADLLIVSGRVSSAVRTTSRPLTSFMYRSVTTMSNARRCRGFWASSPREATSTR